MNDTITRFDPEPKRIGIYINAPRGFQWGVPGTLMFSRIIRDALSADSVRMFSPSGDIPCAPFWREFFSIIPVDDTSSALKTIIREIKDLKLSESAHVAWLNYDEGGWLNEFPKDCAVPFETRLARYHELMALWKDCEDTSSRLEEVLKRYRQTQPRPLDNP